MKQTKMTFIWVFVLSSLVMNTSLISLNRIMMTTQRKTLKTKKRVDTT